MVAVLLENDTRGKVRLPALHIAAKKDDTKVRPVTKNNQFHVGLWIRIRVHFPSWIRIQEGKMEHKQQKICKEIGNNCGCINILKVNFDQLHCFYFILGNFFVISTAEILNKVLLYKFFKALSH